MSDETFIEEAANRIVQLTKDGDLRRHLGQKARETVMQRFLLTRLLEQYLDLFDSFEITFRLAGKVDDNDWEHY